MLLLSRLFNMPKLLPDHKLPLLLKQEVLNAHKLAMQATAADQAPSEDSSSSDSDNMVEHRCTHCRKKRKEVC